MKKPLALCVLTVASLFSGLSHAMFFSYDIEYAGWWEAEGGGSLLGTVIAGEAAVEDGVIDFGSELTDWAWSWTGNTFVSPFSISSDDEGAEVVIFDDVAGVFVDGTPILPDFADGLDQGVFIGGESGEFVVDLEFLTIEDNTISFPFGGDFTEGNLLSSTASVAVTGPSAVPAPALLSLFAIAIPGLIMSRRR